MVRSGSLGRKLNEQKTAVGGWLKWVRVGRPGAAGEWSV
jgi:hypothetical protein